MNISPKIQLLMNSEHAEKINSMLDAGKSANNVHKYLNSQGFSISLPTVYKYSDMRREGLLEKVRMTAQPKTDEGAQMSDMCGPYADDADDAAGARLLTELEALDALIEKGYKAITEMEPEEVTPKLMMDAIRLKNELTGGNHALLTGYGYSSLKALNDKKWELVIQFVMSFIQEDRRDEFQKGVAQIENDVYMGTPWQDEYMRAIDRGK